MENGRRGKKYYYWNIQNSRKFRAHTESSINSSWIDFNRAAEFHLTAQTAGITTQFIGLQLCCGDHLRIQKWLYAKQLQARKPGTLPHLGIYILSFLRSPRINEEANSSWANGTQISNKDCNLDKSTEATATSV